MNAPKKNPPQVLKHIGQDIIPYINLNTGDINNISLFPTLFINSLNPENIDP